MDKIVLPEPNLADAADALFTADNLPEAAQASFDDHREFNNKADTLYYGLNNHTARVLNRLDATHGGRLSKLLSGTAAVESASPTKLPEWAVATADDLLLMAGKTWSNEADPLNYHAARVLARMPVQTLSGDEPPEVTEEDLRYAKNASVSIAPTLFTVKDLLKADRARVWQTHRPQPVDPVRFALEKVDMQALCQLVYVWSYLDQETGKRRVNERQIPNMIAELARILPVAEPVKPWAELTDDVFAEMYSKAVDASCLNTHEDWPVRRKAAGQVLRECFEAYAPPPRKVEVTPEVVRQWRWIWSKTSRQLSTEAGYDGCWSHDVDGLRAAFDIANSQAEARESKEITRLKGEVERLKSEEDRSALALRNMFVRASEEASEVERLTRERNETSQELTTLRAHADKLEAMLTVPGVDGPVKLWEPFERRFPGTVLAKWEAAELALGYSVDGKPQELFARVRYPHAPLQLRQTTASAAETLKRWKVRLPESVDFERSIVTTEPMTRQSAEAIGTVIGEAE